MRRDRLLRVIVAFVGSVTIWLYMAPPLGAQVSEDPISEQKAEAAEQKVEPAELEVVSVDRDLETGEVEVELVVPVGLAGETIPADSVLVLIGNDTQDMSFEALPSNQIEIMLVLDISGSMRGDAIEAAKEAALSFVDRLPPNTRVGVVSFDDESFVNAPLGSDFDDIRASIEDLEVGGDTALFDALGLAASQFSGPAVDARRAVIVLTDGADSASSSTLDEARSSLKSVGADPFAIALATNETATDTLDDLVRGTGGGLDRVDSTEALLPLYDELATQLASRFTVRFTPTGADSGRAVILVNHGGILASANAEFVSAPLLAPPEPDAATTLRPEAVEGVKELASPESAWYTRPVGDWATTATARNVGIAMLATMLLIIGLIVSFPSSGMVTLAQNGKDRATNAQVGDLTARLEEAADRALQKKDRGLRLSRSLERAGIALRPAEFVVIAASVALTIALLAGLLVGILGGVIAFGLSFLAMRSWVGYKAGKRVDAFVDQLPATLQLIAGSLRAGHALPQAAETVAAETDAPTSDEFHRLVTEHRLGRDFSDSLHAMDERIGVEDFSWVVHAIDIHRQVGGDLAEVLDNVNATMRDRSFIRRQFAAVSAEGRYSAYLIVSLPFVVMLILSLTNPAYIGELFNGTRGYVALLLAGTLMLCGSLWMRALMKVKF